MRKNRTRHRHRFVDFNRQILPILSDNCFALHGT